MSLPPGFLDDLRTRITLSTIVGRKVTWDQRKSNMAKGDWWAPCPFHQEKSPSFHVDDRKGFYYCFGCHAKGDAVTFLRESENMGFIEAVELLAREAGMTMPARDPKAAERASRRDQLAEVMEQAARWFRLQLASNAGAVAREYLDRRRLSKDALDRFGIGFAPDARQGLWGHLTDKGVSGEMILAAGLAAEPDDGRQPYDRFRGRIIFPIRDVRGRCIGFGGRAMDPNARAKYYNSPDTELFDKGRSLYNIGPARESAGKGAPLIVAEGYMDVIALSEAGFGAAVAPLGTAITEDQLRMLWQVHPEPVVMLDGDSAGLRAALRLIDLALPMIEAGQGLRFCTLPKDMDPDDLIRAQGAGAMQKTLEAAQPMVALLWRRETEGKVFDSPERRAALDKTLRAAIGRIRDPSIRAHYGEELRRLRFDLFGQRPQHRRPARGQAAPVQPVTRATVLAAAADDGVGDQLREAVILATLALHPALIRSFETVLESIDLTVPDHARLRDALLAADASADGGVLQQLGEDARATLEKLMGQSHLQVIPCLRRPGDDGLARMCLAEEFAKLAARRGALAEIEDAMHDMTGLVDEALTWRLRQAAQTRERAQMIRVAESSDNGEDRVALSDSLDSLIRSEVWVKKKR
jgi:DNA primase